MLFGKVNPGGRTSETWYNDDAELPHISEYGLRVHDTATQMGRTYLYWLGKPAFPFGRGLSYTKFEYSDFSVSKTDCDANDTITVSATVTNTGGMGGYEVVQLYSRKINCYDNKPYKQLSAFKKIWLDSGESRRVELTLPLSELKFWNYPRERYVVEPGDWRLWLGRSSDEDDMLASAEIHVSGEWNAPLSAVTLRCDKRVLSAGDSAPMSLSATLADAGHLDCACLPFELSSSDTAVA